MADYVYPPVVIALKTLWRAMGLRFDFRGQENLPKLGEGGAVLAINHIGYLDFALAGTAALPMKRYIRFMAKSEIFDNPISGPLMRGMHHISVNREAGSTSLVAALRALRAGEIVGIFPEATISRSFEVKKLKSGAVRLAQGAGVPVIPVAIWGSQRIYTKGHKKHFGRNRIPVSVTFGEPITVPKGADILLAEEDLRQRLITLLTKVQSDYPDSHRGQWWAPARLGGTAMSLEEAEIESARVRQARLAKLEAKKQKKEKK